MSHVETIAAGGRLCCYIVRGSFLPQQTTFVTPPEAIQQVGFIVREKGGNVARHVHKPVERKIVGTPEVLVVRSGKCEIDLYNEAMEIVATRELVTGDVVLLLSGGHGFRMLDDTTLMEVKQGPYVGYDDKVRF